MDTTHIEATSISPLAPADRAERIEHLLTLGAAITIAFSIAASQILLGAALLVRIVRGRRFRLPRFLIPMAAFWGLSVLAIIRSADPARGMLDLKKLYLFVIVPLTIDAFDALRIHTLLVAWTISASLSAMLALWQFAERWHEAVILQAPLYEYLLDGRIHGFQGHWMTFGGIEMIALMFLLAFLLFGEPVRWKISGWFSAALIWLTLVLGLSRGIFLAGVPAGVAALLWFMPRGRVLLAAIPASIALLIMTVSPLRERTISAIAPHGDIDSNSRRMLMLRTGIRMIAAHPFLGIGPGQVEPQFDSYLPPGTPRPLPKGWYGHLHNVYLQYGAERGLPAALCILWMATWILRDSYRAIVNHAPTPWIQHGVIAVTVALLAEGFFEHNLGDSEVLTMFLIVATCGYVLQRRQGGERWAT